MNVTAQFLTNLAASLANPDHGWIVTGHVVNTSRSGDPFTGTITMQEHTICLSSVKIRVGVGSRAPFSFAFRAVFDASNTFRTATFWNDGIQYESTSSSIATQILALAAAADASVLADLTASLALGPQ